MPEDCTLLSEIASATAVISSDPSLTFADAYIPTADEIIDSFLLMGIPSPFTFKLLKGQVIYCVVQPGSQGNVQLFLEFAEPTPS